jgi:hypothetical protein
MRPTSQLESIASKGAKRKKTIRVEDHPAFGIWKDREDMKDVHAWLRKMRPPRYLRDGGTLFSPPPEKSGRERKT